MGCFLWDGGVGAEGLGGYKKNVCFLSKPHDYPDT